MLSGADLSGLVLVLDVIPISTASESMWLKLDLELIVLVSNEKYSKRLKTYPLGVLYVLKTN